MIEVVLSPSANRALYNIKQSCQSIILIFTVLQSVIYLKKDTHLTQNNDYYGIIIHGCVRVHYTQIHKTKN